MKINKFPVKYNCVECNQHPHIKRNQSLAVIKICHVKYFVFKFKCAFVTSLVVSDVFEHGPILKITNITHYKQDLEF